MADMLNLKKWVVITSRSGWLLELLTELKKMVSRHLKQMTQQLPYNFVTKVGIN